MCCGHISQQENKHGLGNLSASRFADNLWKVNPPKWIQDAGTCGTATQQMTPKHRNLLIFLKTPGEEELNVLQKEKSV